MQPSTILCMSAEAPKRRKCGFCKGEGHDRRNCPSLRPIQANISAIGDDQNQNGVGAGPSRPTPAPTVAATHSNINWDRVCYVLFDLETTGGSRTDDDIIEIAATVLGPDGIALEDGSFDSLIRPNKDVSTFISSLTGITNEMVQTASTFPEVIVKFFEFVDGLVNNFVSAASTPIENIVLVAHNGRVFDVPFLLRSLQRYKLHRLWADPQYGVTIDTLHVARKVFANDRQKPTDMKLGTLFQFLTGKDMENCHRASGDVKALYTVFRSERFWAERTSQATASIIEGTNVALPQNDSDASESDSDADSVEGNHKEKATSEQKEDDTDGDDSIVADVNAADDDTVSEDEQANEIVGDYWSPGHFIPTEVPIDQFKEHFTSQCRSSVVRTGIQVSPGMANSPIKAWRLIFTAAILEKIIRYTNRYGERNCKEWTTIEKKDFTDFVAVLFLMSIQKRKDKPSNWFSDNQLLECKVVKRITTGRKFGRMLRYIHCCDPDDTGINAEGEYDPSYKIRELKEDLEKRWTAVFVPEQQLSLDETLIRAFGRMKFKVRIVTKAARYGIKLYVITDARTSFVLRVIVYTGKFTYWESKSESTKKTVQVVQQLCEPFRGSYRTIYVDRFYSSIDLIKQLEEMKLYTTGTILSNRIPKQFSLAKSSRDFKLLQRGDSITHTLNYMTSAGERKQAGLVAWKDSNMVYCITNDTSTVPTDDCRRRGLGGIIIIKRPEVITLYNKYMGGVDVADMRRLHCNSTIMGQNRWWLKLFFYLLDAGTSNALVVYNEAMSDKQKAYNIMDFKAKLVETLVGAKLKDVVDNNGIAEHAMTPTPNGERQRCSYCTLLGEYSRTRFMCEGCGVPYCSIGSGKTGKDCFALAHDNEQIREMCVERYGRQQTHTKKTILKKR